MITIIIIVVVVVIIIIIIIIIIWDNYLSELKNTCKNKILWKFLCCLKIYQKR